MTYFTNIVEVLERSKDVYVVSYQAAAPPALTGRDKAKNFPVKFLSSGAICYFVSMILMGCQRRLGKKKGGKVKM